jgi:hypothetical protein
MAIRIRRGTNADRITVVLESGEVAYTTDTKMFYIGDGTTLGGTLIGPSAAGAVAWGAITGTLASQTDLNTALGTKVTGNTAITGATKTKITYDSKGLVTVGADATTADIAASTNKNYVTDAEQTVITNTSGTNTGNQTLANTSDSSSHTATLSATGGSIKLVEGSNITLTTTGTGADGIITIASTGGGGTVTSVAALTLTTSGTDLTSSVANGTTTPVITLNVPDASATARGVISTSPQTIAGDKTFTGTTSGITKSMVGLNNVDNTSDVNKPVSTATQTALNLKQDTLVSGTNLKTINSTTLLGSGNITTGTVTSVGVSMPSAFSVASSPITTSGTIAITGAGVVSQYVRGDGSLANFPQTSGGGSSVSYYLNGSVAQGTLGGVAFKEINKTPIIGAGTDFTISADGYIQSFITDANDPNQLLIPGGNWNFETYFSASSAGGTPSFYVELYKYDGTSLTLIASNSATPESITGGTAIDLYITALAVPQTVLTLTDRLAIRFYVTHSGRTITMHTENSHLSQIITTFTSGLTALNGLTAQIQSLATGTTGTDFNISSATATHTFNLPDASASNRGALTSANWTTFNGKESALTFSSPLSRATNTISIPVATTSVNGYLSSTDWTTFNGKVDYAPRVQSVTSSATVTPTSTNDLVKITAQAAGLTIANPTGTMSEGQAMIIRIKDNGTAQTIAFGTNYRAIGVTLPTTTTISKTIYIGLVWNDTDTKFDVLGINTQA